jgi:prepilin-type N-terminal cleavage/methylation domain-containing protein
MEMRTKANQPGLVPPKAGFTPLRAGFTLIELLVVVAIIGVLFAVALPVFENAGRKSPERATFQVMATMRLARQNAIAKRQWTLVVFPNTDGGVYAAKDLDKCLRAYAVLAATNNLDGDYKFDPTKRDPSINDMQLTFVSDWKYLPDGIYFDDDKELSSNYLFGRGGYYTATFRFPLDPAKPNDLVRPMAAVLFKPNGRAYMMSDGSPTGKYWQDMDYSKLYITAAKYYEQAAGTLSPAKIIGDTNLASVIMIRNKTGQIQIWDGTN